MTHTARRYGEPTPRHARNQFTACFQKMKARILIAFASGKFFPNRQKSVFGKSVPNLNKRVAKTNFAHQVANAALTRCTVEKPFPTILAVLRTDCPARTRRTISL